MSGIVTGTITSVAGSALVTGTIASAAPSIPSVVVTATASSSSGPTFNPGPSGIWGYGSNDPSAALGAFVLEFGWMLSVALGAVEIGLVFAALTFGAVVTKAISYFRGNTMGDGALVKTTVASMLLINFVQMIATIQGTYTMVIVDFGHIEDFASLPASTMLQILFTTLTACIAQLFFAFRLHAIMRNYFLTVMILIFTTLQLAISIYAVTVLFTVGNFAILMYFYGDAWPLITTYAISSVINITIAAVAYVRMQKPYVLQKHGRTTFMSELEYWTVKSLFFTGILSLLGAIAAGIMMGNMIWVTLANFLGNLYTLSVLLNLNSRILAIPVASRPSPNPQAQLSDRASATTLTDDMAIWEDMVKHQAIKASLSNPTKEAEADLPAYTTGYHQVNDGAV